jgi:hypothetical protein
MAWHYGKSTASGKMEMGNIVQIIEHNSISEANRWLKQNHKKGIMHVQCHYLGEETGLLGESIYKVTITYKH